MIWQVRANLFFDEEDEALDFHHDCRLAYDKSVTINPGQENAELPSVELIKNHHDDDPNKPCELVAAIPTP